MRQLYDCWFLTKDDKIRQVEMYADKPWQAKHLVEKKYKDILKEWYRGPNIR